MVISVSHVAKYFERYARPQDRLKQMLWRGRRNYYTPYWALRDVSFIECTVPIFPENTLTVVP